MGKTILFPPQKNKKAARRTPPAGGITETDYSVIRAGLIQEKDRALADRLETQNAVVCRELVLRDILKSTSGRIGGTYSGIILQLGETLSGLVGAIMGVRDDPTADAAIREIFMEREYETAHCVKVALDRWIRRREGTYAE